MTNHPLLQQLQQAAYFKNHTKVLIAVSGGVDSMNLLHFLHTYQEDLGIQIAIAHVNHKQRLESEAEEQYLQQWAEHHQVAYFVSHFQGQFTEQRAREWRYAFFKSVMAEQGYTALVTAHHQDDQVETILMRVIRGSRLRHLSGIKVVQPFGTGELIRPFLSLSKKDLGDCYHFEDRSNQNRQFLRNRIRHDLLPMLKTENPRFSEAMVSLAMEIGRLNAALKDLTQDLSITDAPVFLAQSLAVQDYLLQTYLESFPDLQLSKAQYEEVLHVLRTKSSYYHPLKRGYFLKKTPSEIAITRIGPETDSHGFEQLLYYGSTVSYESYRVTWSTDNSNDGIPIFSEQPILLRSRKPGDRIDLGHFQKKISRLLIDGKLSAEAKTRIIIGEQAGQISFVWTEGKTYLRKVSENAIMTGKLYIQKQ